MTARAAFAERLVACCTILGACMFAIGAVVVLCVLGDWALNRLVRSLRLYALFVEFMWSRRKPRDD